MRMAGHARCFHRGGGARRSAPPIWTPSPCPSPRGRGDAGGPARFDTSDVEAAGPIPSIRPEVVIDRPDGAGRAPAAPGGLAAPRLVEFWREGRSGKSIARILANHCLAAWRAEFSGTIVDLGSGGTPS